MNTVNEQREAWTKRWREATQPYRDAPPTPNPNPPTPNPPFPSDRETGTFQKWVAAKLFALVVKLDPEYYSENDD